MKKTALIIDDLPEYREIIKTCLIKHGYHIIEAGTGEEGIALYKKNKTVIDLITMDFQMPGLNGVETAQKIWAITPGVTIIGISDSPQAMRRCCEQKRVNLTIIAKQDLPEALDYRV